MNFIRRLLPDSAVETRYIKAGETFGNAVSYTYFGECVGFEGWLKKWGKWEKEYARRGFRTVSLDKFISLGGYEMPIDDVIGQRRENGEKPIFHAQIYRDEFLGKVTPVVNLRKIITQGGISTGQYGLPSTEQSE